MKEVSGVVYDDSLTKRIPKCKLRKMVKADIGMYYGIRFQEYGREGPVLKKFFEPTKLPPIDTGTVIRFRNR